MATLCPAASTGAVAPVRLHLGREDSNCAGRQSVRDRLGCAGGGWAVHHPAPHLREQQGHLSRSHSRGTAACPQTGRGLGRGRGAVGPTEGRRGKGYSQVQSYRGYKNRVTQKPLGNGKVHPSHSCSQGRDGWWYPPPSTHHSTPMASFLFQLIALSWVEKVLVRPNQLLPRISLIIHSPQSVQPCLLSVSTSPPQALWTSYMLPP